MKLSEILPLDSIRARFPNQELVVRELFFADIAMIAHESPNCLHTIGMNVWNRIVVNWWDKVKPKALADHVDARDPMIYQKIEKLLKKKIVHDIYWADVSVADAKLADPQVARILVAHVYQNDIQLGDIVLQNPYMPLSASDNRRRFQDCKGLGLLGEVIDGMHRFGVENKCLEMTLTAASLDQVKLFSKHGFIVENSITGQNGLKIGLGVPMERPI